MLRFAVLLASVLVSLTCARAQEATIYPAEAFFETTQFRLAAPDGTWTSDGRALLVSSDETGIFNAYRLDTGTGERTPLTKSRKESIFAIGWMPDDQSFLYTADQGGNELNHVYLRLANGQVVDLTPGNNVKADFLGWGPGKRTFFLSTNERDPSAFDIYRYDSRTLGREMVFENELLLGGLTVGPRGRWVAGLREISSKKSDVYVAKLGGGDPRNLTEDAGDVEHAVYTFDPSGKRLVIGTDETSEFREARTVSISRGRQKTLIADTWDVSAVAFSPSGKYRVQSINADGRTLTEIWDVARRRPVKLPAGMPEGQVTQVRFAPDDSAAAVLISSSRSPADIYIVPLDERSVRVNRLTEALGDRIEERDLVAAEIIRYESFDGLLIPAIQYRPLGAREDAPVPAIVYVHGGPGGQSRATYNASIQHLVNNGYAVLAVNNRGSSGYGKTFYHMDDRRHGDVDLKDVVAARTYLEGLDWVDGDKVAVMGGSYGGFMTMAALAFTPEAFDAGINIFGVTNWERTLTSIPPWWGSFRDSLYDEMGDPATDQMRHRSISPLFHADRIIRPVLIVQGANDPRVLQIESDEMVAALRQNGVPVEYVLFDDEGHGFRKRKNRIAANEAYVRFLDSYLQGDVVPGR